ncbi:MAG TPA: formate dehydrogenase accessory sulfurtransferase FdhD [Candidatus Methylomirabilis sp.]|nr:formate dehydrogenase accessory sulfurtransferase FdhD [Candidatus Methylomirabilis sp.]
MDAALYRPVMSRAGLAPTHPVTALDEYGEPRDLQIAGEFPLTLKVDGREVVTLMTLGTRPEELALGYLRNQRLIERIEDIRAVAVDWDRNLVQVDTHHGHGIVNWEKKLAKRTVTTGCGQGTVFSCTLDKLYDVRLPRVQVRQSLIYGLLRALSDHNEIYRSAGGVHGCALCRETLPLIFVEDVGRHNAADAIAGRMWLDRISGHDKIFYTTGRLTSEIVMKAAHMGIPVLLSRSGITHMGLELARELGIVMIARAKGNHFLVYQGADAVLFDARPPVRPMAETAVESS